MTSGQPAKFVKILLKSKTISSLLQLCAGVAPVQLGSAAQEPLLNQTAMRYANIVDIFTCCLPAVSQLHLPSGKAWQVACVKI